MKIVILATLMLILSTSTSVPIGVDKSKIETNTTVSINSTNKHIDSNETKAKVTEKPSLGKNDAKVAKQSENTQMKMEGDEETKNKLKEDTKGKAKIENIANVTGREPKCKICNEQKEENNFDFTQNMNESDLDSETLNNEQIKFDNIINLDRLTSPADDSSPPPYNEYDNITEDTPSSELSQKEGIGILIPFKKQSVESIVSPLLPASLLKETPSYGYGVDGSDANMNDSSVASSEIDQMEEENSEMPENLKDSPKKARNNIKYHLGNPLALGLHFPLWPLKEMLNRVETVMSLMNLTKGATGTEDEANATQVKTVELNGRKYVLRAKIFSPDGDNRFFVRLISLTPLEEEFKQDDRETEEHDDKIGRILLGSQEEPPTDMNKEKSEEENNLDEKKKEEESEDEKKGMKSKAEGKDKKKEEKSGGDSSDSDDDDDDKEN